MKKYTVANLVMAVLYIPLSLFCFLMGMATEAVYPDMSVFLIVEAYILAWGGMLIGALAHPCLILSQYYFSKKENPTAGRIFRFLPLIAVAGLVLLSLGLEALANIL